MEHQWEAVIDSPQEGHCLRSTSRSALINCPGIQLKGQQVLLCVCVCAGEQQKEKTNSGEGGLSGLLCVGC